MKRFTTLILTFAMLALVASIASCREDTGFLKIDKKYAENVFDANGGTVQIPVNTTHADFTSRVLSGEDWIQTEQAGLSVKITVAPMSGNPDRRGSVRISAPGCPDAEVSVLQNAITVTELPESIALSNSQLTFSVQITAGCRIGFQCPAWITPVDATWVPGTKTYTFEASMFMDGTAETRSGTLKIESLDDRVSWKAEIPVVQTSYTNAALQSLADLWKSSPLNLTTERYGLLAKIEGYSNEFNRDPFQAYLKMNAADAEKTEEDNAIMSIYRFSFDRVLEQVKNTTVAYGTAEIWMLYNMGYIVKTPSVCFGVDINHYYASKLEPYLDFICVTHADNDHIDTPLMNAMASAGKPVISNFFTASAQWCSQSATTYRIGDTEIRTCITDENATDLNCTTIFRFSLGEDSGNFRFMHPGDSSFDPAQFAYVGGGEVDLLILRSGQKAEANILGSGTGKVIPTYIFLAHQIELRHYIEKSPMRATILGSLENKDKNFGSYASRTYLPFWGEHLVWKDGKIQ